MTEPEKSEKPEGAAKTTQTKPAAPTPAPRKPGAPPLDDPQDGGHPPAGETPKPGPEEEPKPGPARKPWEQWAKEKRAAAAELRTAKTLHRWPVGRELTEAEFDAALVAARNLVFR